MTEFKLGQITVALRQACSIRSGRIARGTALVSAGALLGVSAFAQDAAAPAAAAPASSAASSAEATLANATPAVQLGVQQVTVTARKVKEFAQEVPVSISAVRADELEKKADVSLADYFTEVPGLAINSRGGGRTEVVLRGISTGSDTNPTTATLIGDSPFGASSTLGNGGSMLPDLDPFDIRQIEVLRGPQGTLYGASNLGGLIKYVPVTPDATKFSGRAEVDGSTVAHGDSGYGVRAAVNVPVIENKLALRVSAFDRQDPGYIDDPLQGRKDVNKLFAKGGRVSGAWFINDDWTIKASALHQNAKADGSPTVDFHLDGTPIDDAYSHRRLPGTDLMNRSVNFYDLNVDGDLPWAHFASVTSSSNFKYSGPQDVTSTFQPLINQIFGVPNAGAAIAQTTNNDKWSQEVRLESQEDPKALIDWRVGLFYTAEDNHLGQNLQAVDATSAASLGLPTLFVFSTHHHFEEEAAFGTLTYHFTPKFDVQAGGRFSQNDQHYLENDDGVLNGGPSTLDASSKDHAFTYLVTPRYRFSRDLMAYATLSSGYRPGGPNPGVPSPLPKSYGHDTTTNFELGLKGSLLEDRSISYALAAFHIDWKDIQLLARDPVTQYTYYVNGSGAKSDGAELSATWYPAAGWSLSGTYAFTDATLTKNPPSQVDGVSGDRLPFSARNTGSISLTKEWSLGSMKASTGVSAAYVGSREGNFITAGSGETRFELPSYTQVDLQGGLSTATWSANLFVKNVADTKGYLFGGNNANATQTRTLIRPRTVGISLATNF